jgi:outer membrane immunogenic protein
MKVERDLSREKVKFLRFLSLPSQTFKQEPGRSLTDRHFSGKPVGMKAFIRFALPLVVSGLLTVIAYAGPEAFSGKEMKQVAPVTPPSCDWSGFYLGVNVGGQFGHSEDKDLDNYNFPDRPWGYSESSVIAGEQAGYNWQWGHIVFGPEIDAGYMNLNGRGIEPGIPHDTYGESNSDFYTTFRGRIGIACHCWLLYATGGGIGVNYEGRVIDTSVTRPGPDTINASKEEFDWGYTFGGGVERMFDMWGRRWSFKVEYLYFGLDSQTFSATSGNGFGPYGWRAETEGHIVRGGLNFHF